MATASRHSSLTRVERLSLHQRMHTFSTVLLSHSRVAVWSVLNVLVLAGCGGDSPLYAGAKPSATDSVIEGYNRHYGLYSDRAEITGVDRVAEAGTKRAILGGFARTQIPPGDRCVQLEIKTCVLASGCGDTTFCAFANYFVAGQYVRLKAGSLKLDKPASSGDAVVRGTMQIEISAKGFATVTRSIIVSCGGAVRGASERGTPELPRQALPSQVR